MFANVLQLLGMFWECPRACFKMSLAWLSKLFWVGSELWGSCWMFSNCLEIVPAKLYKCVGGVSKMFGDDPEHVLKRFGVVFERVCKCVRVWGGDTPCKNPFSARFARRFPLIFMRNIVKTRKKFSRRASRAENFQ